jgi:hypothetical protein
MIFKLANDLNLILLIPSEIPEYNNKDQAKSAERKKNRNKYLNQNRFLAGHSNLCPGY